MNDKTKKIVFKLPCELQKEFAKDYALNPRWSPQWDEWAKDVIYQLDLARNEGIITKEEWYILWNDIFAGRIGGTIGSCPNTNWKRMLEYLKYGLN